MNDLPSNRHTDTTFASLLTTSSQSSIATLSGLSSEVRGRGLRRGREEGRRERQEKGRSERAREGERKGGEKEGGVGEMEGWSSGERAVEEGKWGSSNLSSVKYSAMQQVTVPTLSPRVGKTSAPSLVQEISQSYAS